MTNPDPVSPTIAPKMPPSQEEQPKEVGKRKALLIGVSDYEEGEGKEYCKLPSCMNDIKKLGEMLKDPNIGNFEVKTLEDPTSKVLGSEIRAFCKPSHEKDILLIYFSGHGVFNQDLDPSFYLLGRDINNADEAEFGISGSQIDHWILGHFGKSPQTISKTHIIILDCCNAAGFANGLQLRQIGDQGGDKYHWGGCGTAILVPSLSTNLTPAKGNNGCSLYTELLIDCLTDETVDDNRDGFISVEELNNLIKKRAEEKNLPLNPCLIPRGETAHKIHIAGSPATVYRREVLHYAVNGEVPKKERPRFSELRTKLNLPESESEDIETSVREEWVETSAKREQYRQKFYNAAKVCYPLRAEDQQALDALQKDLALSDPDTEEIRWSTDVAAKLEKPEIRKEASEGSDLEYPPIVRWLDGKVMILVQFQSEDQKSFYIDKYPVTITQYKAFNGQWNNSYWEKYKKNYGWKDDFLGTFPVTDVSLQDAMRYAKSFKKELPKSEQLHYAAFGNRGEAYPWGNEWQDNRCNSVELWQNQQVRSFPQITLIMRFPPQNDLGLCDLFGNTQEIVMANDTQSGHPFGISFRDQCISNQNTSATLVKTPPESFVKNQSLGFRCIVTLLEYQKKQKN